MRCSLCGDQCGMEKELSVIVSVINEFGLHARPASKIVQMAAKARGNIWFLIGDEQVDGKSLIDLLSAGAMKDSSMEINIDNPVDEPVLHEIEMFFKQGFGEL